MTSIVYDFAAIAKLTKAFAEEPPQNEVKPPVVRNPTTDESHVYGYGEGTDYVYAVMNSAVTVGAPVSNLTSGTGSVMGIVYIGNEWVDRS